MLVTQSRLDGRGAEYGAARGPKTLSGTGQKKRGKKHRSCIYGEICSQCVTEGILSKKVSVFPHFICKTWPKEGSQQANFPFCVVMKV